MMATHSTEIRGSQVYVRTGTRTIAGIGGGVLLLAAGVVAAIELLAFVSDEDDAPDDIDEDAVY